VTAIKLPEIIFENDDCIVLNKPSGLYSIPDRKQLEINLKDLLIEKYGIIFTVHRLDAPTSGVILFAKNEQTHKDYTQQFENRLTKKLYTGLVHGSPYEPEGVIEAPMLEHPGKNGKMVVNRKGKEAVTKYKVIRDFKRYSVLEFDILTGRTHQIRVHCTNIGHPIIADELYGDGKGIYLSTLKKKFNLGKDVYDEKPIIGRLALHAQSLSIAIDKKIRTFEAPLPKDMAVTIKQLEKYLH
jgi:23S rRNA pseudouridine955/2504/2580 synthase/23S rRNA pseudouridine1911/1915/1917 synthase